MKRPVWLFSMDSENFSAPPTTTAALTAWYRKYGTRADDTAIELVHFRDPGDITPWLASWEQRHRAVAEAALAAGQLPVAGFSFYTWNAAEFLALARSLRDSLPAMLHVAGGPHVQQAEDYLGEEALDVIVLGEGEITFGELLDASDPTRWADIAGLAYLRRGEITRTAKRERQVDLDEFPSPLDVLELRGPDGEPLYEAISYETSRGCPFRCAFCEWGTGAIGGKMYQWSMDRIRSDWQKISDSGIQDIWLADSNFGALREDLDKARLIVELKQRHGFPRSFATSWSKKHSKQVQAIALMLHQHRLLPHYQLALQTLTPEALKMSNRANMSSNQYEPIARHMAAEGVPIAAELIWGLPGDNLPSFEANLDTLLATFPNINIFAYTLLPGTEFYERREELEIQAVPVAGYGKARGEYVVGSYSYDREQGEEGYFLITAHQLLIHGHVMPLTVRFLALSKAAPVSSLLRRVLRELLTAYGEAIPGLDTSDRIQVFEQRNALYLHALRTPGTAFRLIRDTVDDWLRQHDCDAALRQQLRAVLDLDEWLCPRVGPPSRETLSVDVHAEGIQRALANMELPGPECFETASRILDLRHPGGVGEILQDVDGGSWLKGEITPTGQALAIA